MRSVIKMVIMALLLLWVLPAISKATDCACTECSADPGFVQADMRALPLLQILKQLGALDIAEEGLKAVIVFSDGDVPCCGEGAASPRTMMLLGSKGTARRVDVSGGLPTQIKQMIGYSDSSPSQSP